jgi:hypothetical protein
VAEICKVTYLFSDEDDCSGLIYECPKSYDDKDIIFSTIPIEIPKSPNGIVPANK